MLTRRVTRRSTSVRVMIDTAAPAPSTTYTRCRCLPMSVVSTCSRQEKANHCQRRLDALECIYSSGKLIKKQVSSRRIPHLLQGGAQRHGDDRGAGKQRREAALGHAAARQSGILGDARKPTAQRGKLARRQQQQREVLRSQPALGYRVGVRGGSAWCNVLIGDVLKRNYGLHPRGHRTTKTHRMSDADRFATSLPPSVRPRLLLWSRAMKPNTSSAGMLTGTASED